MSNNMYTKLIATGPATFIDRLCAEEGDNFHLTDRTSPESVELVHVSQTLFIPEFGEIVAAYPELSFSSKEYWDGDDADAVPVEVLSERPAEEPVETVAPAKMRYETPFVPRKLWFKQQREAGLLPPRQRKTAEVVELAPKRSPKQIAAIRGYYARKNAKKAA